MNIQPSFNTSYATVQPQVDRSDRAQTATGVEFAPIREDVPPVESAQNETATQNQKTETQQPASADESAREAAAKQELAQQELEDKALIDQLKARDREVRVHENAHAAVGGQYAGAPTYEYTRGPDGKQYATGGEVSISVSEGRTPQDTIEKARVIQAAALAPAEPSAQDRKVAAEAAQMEMSAQAELRQQKSDEKTETAEQSEPGESVTTDAAPATTNSPQTAQAENELQEKDSASVSPVATNGMESRQQALQKGLANPQNPFGKDGQINLFA